MKILRDIIDRKRVEVEKLSDPGDVPLNDRSLRASLLANRDGLIFEIKPRSPSKGDLIERSRVPEFVELYNRVAAGISVLCDEVDFGGGYDLLAEVRAQTDLPILAKEFVVDSLQIKVARSVGANAVLLIASVLSTEKIQELADAAVALNMDVLVELHEEDEIEKIPAIPYKHLILGINNRNLDTLEIDFTATEQLAPLVRERYPHAPLLSESGIDARADMDRLLPHVDGFLIGTGVLRAKDPSLFIQDLSSLPAADDHVSHQETQTDNRTSKVKVCGITRLEDLITCEELGVEYVGLNFVESSPRFLSDDQAKALAAQRSCAQLVGIFVDEDPVRVNHLIDICSLDYVQLHGNESIDLIGQINASIIKAFRTVPSADVIQHWIDAGAQIMLDGSANGELADLNQIAELPENIRSCIFLAGGLTPDNVQSAVDRIHPLVVDVASGVETSPGIKNADLIHSFLSVLQS